MAEVLVGDLDPNFISPVRDLGVCEDMEVYQRFPFLQFDPGEYNEYMTPEYYDDLLQRYAFGGVADKDMLKPVVEDVASRTDSPVVVELGTGTGRVTRHVLDLFEAQGSASPTYLGNDFSPDMVSSMEGLQIPGATFYEADHLAMLQHMAEGEVPAADLVFSQWSYTHSVGEHIVQFGADEAEEKFRSALGGVVSNAMTEQGELHIIQFDAKSPEQTILQKAWRDIEPDVEPVANGQSETLGMTRNALTDIVADGNGASLEFEHHVGDEIEYDSIDSALEIFMNLHLEGLANNVAATPAIVDRMVDDLRQYEDGSTGKLRIAPGCFTFHLKKGSQ